MQADIDDNGQQPRMRPRGREMVGWYEGEPVRRSGCYRVCPEPRDGELSDPDEFEEGA